MYGQLSSGVLIEPSPAWSILFAQDADQDLEFDEGLEDDELDQHKPPSRRPLLWIIILLVAVGVVYWALNPDFSMLSGTPSSREQASPRTVSPVPGAPSPTAASSSAIPSPKFGEGEKVLLARKPGENATASMLKGNAAGTQSGPQVKPGELLTILDGEIIKGGWIYRVRTKSGATGWVSEKDIKAKT